MSSSASPPLGPGDTNTSQAPPSESAPPTSVPDKIPTPASPPAQPTVSTTEPQPFLPPPSSSAAPRPVTTVAVVPTPAAPSEPRTTDKPANPVQVSASVGPKSMTPSQGNGAQSQPQVIAASPSPGAPPGLPAPSAGQQIPQAVGASSAPLANAPSFLSSTELAIQPPSSFVRSRKPFSTETVVVIGPTATSTTTTMPETRAEKRSQASGIIAGVVLAIMFGLLLLLVFKKPRRRRETSVPDADLAVPTSPSSISTFSGSSYLYDEKKQPDKRHMTSPSVHVSMVDMPSTPPLSGLYSPKAWASMLATPERPALTERERDDDAASVSVYSTTSRTLTPSYLGTSTKDWRGRVHSHGDEFPVTPSVDGVDAF